MPGQGVIFGDPDQRATIGQHRLGAEMHRGADIGLGRSGKDGACARLVDAALRGGAKAVIGIGGGVDQRVATGHAGDQIGIGQGAHDGRRAELGDQRCGGGGTDQRHHGNAAGGEMADQVAADIAAGAGEENLANGQGGAGRRSRGCVD